MSRKTRSGVPRRSNSTASRPLAHSSIRVTLVICCSTPRRRRRAGASSSTMLARMIGVWNLDCRERPARGRRRVRQVEPIARAIQLLQPRPGVGDPQSGSVPALALRHTRTVVADLEVQPIAFARGGDLDLGDAAVRHRAVANGVLHQWLQQQRWYHGAAGARIDTERHAQAIAEARLLNRDVMIEQLELFL